VHAAQAEVAVVCIPPSLTKTVAEVWRELQVAGFDVSARKFRWIKRMVRARAWLHGRDEVTVDDLDIIADCAWDNPEDRSAILRVVINASCPAAAQAVEAMDIAIKALEDIPELTGRNEGEVATAGSYARSKIIDLVHDVQQLRDDAASHEKDRLDQIIAELQSIQTRVLRRMQDLARGIRGPS
jgi:MoxR-like ATPase